ncbi:MAG: beta-ketoacyl synthase N-terminal-like domain-containing protein [Azospirillaceae bacterium]|nr:beta-ketoacyl synthase N-terminal-like domain-containing protein [Azospirillaceae bacterium]
MTTPPPDDAIAVVGMACRLPGADTPDAFWTLLRDGRDTLTRFSEAELLAAGVAPDLIRRPDHVPAKGVLAQADSFDAAFFGISPREAELMDPQQRVFVECAWAALEDAGYEPGALPGAVGVFAGSILSTYLLQNLWPDPGLIRRAGAFPMAIGNDPTFLATRVAYLLGLSGPAISVGTACSTSLVAVHLACQSLLCRESDAALAGGVSIHLPLIGGYRYEQGGILSPDGHCRPFDAAAQGTVSSDGAGVVMLKRLADARADGDTVHAVIRGSAVNNDGREKVGYTAPGVAPQARVIAEAMAVADVAPSTIALVEAHAAGTNLGDPVEVAALAEAFGDAPGPIALGSVKGNIGHVDAAAGIAGLIKTVLALRHRAIPPCPHFQAANPRLGLERTPFRVPTTCEPYVGDGPMRAGVSSFGIGGTNVHVVLEEAPADMSPPAATTAPAQLLVLSARTPAALNAASARLADHLESHPTLSLADVAHTLRLGRRPFAHRRAVVAATPGDAAQALRDKRRQADGVAPDAIPEIAFLFPGLGDHYPGMGWELYCAEPVYRAAVDRCAAALRAHLPGDIRASLYPGRDPARPVIDPPPAAAPAIGLDLRAMLGRGGRAETPAEGPETAQPAIFVAEYALAALLRHWGLEPAVLTGYSIGEFAAACVAGILSLEDALAVVATRATLIATRVAPGAMLAVPLGEDALRPLLPPGADLAAVNTARLSVVSGPEAAIAALEETLNGRDIAAQRLRSTHAYHSTMLEPIVPDLAAVLGRVRLSPPRIPVVSCVTGTRLTDAQARDPLYWARHLCRTVRLKDVLAELLRDPHRILLEVGPGQSLTAHALAERAAHPGSANRIAPTMRWSYDRQPEWDVLLRAIGQAWLGGAGQDAARLLAGEGRRRLSLPTYPFERQRYWIDPPVLQPAGATEGPAERRPDVAQWTSLPYWKPAVAQPDDTGALDGPWLVFRDRLGIGAALAERLRDRGCRVITVDAGAAFALDGDEAVIRAGTGDDYDQLVATLQQRGVQPRRVAHLWLLTGPATGVIDVARFDAQQTPGFHSVMHLLRALPAGAGLRIDVIADGLFDPNGSDPAGAPGLRPEKSTVLGPVLVAPQERPGLICRCIDVPAPEGAVEDTANAVMAELGAAALDVMVARRGGRRWIRDYEPVPLPAPAASPFRQRGVYLLTGGLGGVGMVLAEHLAAAVQARLVLVGRTALPARAAWDDWLAAHPPADATATRIRRIRAMEAKGAEVLALAADVTDTQAMAGVLQMSEYYFGTLDGVIHGAGTVGVEAFRDIGESTVLEAETQFDAKARGLLVLDRLLADRPLHCRLAMSSLAAVLGGLGFSAYAAANLFLDAHAAATGRWTSVDWDSWRLGDTEPAIAGLGATVNIFHMAAEEGVDAASRILAAGLTGPVVVSSGDIKARLRQWVARTKPAPAPQAAHARADLRNTYTAPRGELEATLAEIWSDLFNVTPIGVHDNFFELGGHSLLATQLNARITARLGVELSLATLLRAPTVEEQGLAVLEARARHLPSDVLARLLAEMETASASPPPAVSPAPAFAHD